MRRTPYIVREKAECSGEYVATVMYGAEGLEASASTSTRARDGMLRVGSMAALLSLSLRAKAKASGGKLQYSQTDVSELE